jgi:hypothetical protein
LEGARLPGPKKKKTTEVIENPKAFLDALRADPQFKELEDIRAMCGRYMDEDGRSSREDDDDIEETDILPEDLGRDHFKDQEMLDRATDWAQDHDRVMAFLQLMAVSSKKGARKKAPWPKGVPSFDGPSQMIDHFKGRWEKLKCRYC